VGRLEEATADELSETMTLVQASVRALHAGYEPDGFNIGMNLGDSAGAGVPGHIHMHVLPRWTGDANFMTTIAETRVLPETVGATYERVKAALLETVG